VRPGTGPVIDHGLERDTVDGLNSRGNGQADRTARRSDSRKSHPMLDRERMRKRDHRDDHRSDAGQLGQVGHDPHASAGRGVLGECGRKVVGICPCRMQPGTDDKKQSAANGERRTEAVELAPKHLDLRIRRVGHPGPLPSERGPF
jgi:hypothetical protein